MHELVVGESVLPSAGVDANDPKSPEVALAGAPVAVRVAERLEHLLLRPPVAVLLEAAVALGLLEHLAALLLRMNASLDACHPTLLLLPLAEEAQRPPPLGMRHLTSPEHDGHLDLVPVLEEADDVSLLGRVVVWVNLRPELDLLDRDGGLVLAGELRLLLLLVLVLRVVHHPAHRRLGVRRHF